MEVFAKIIESGRLSAAAIATTCRSVQPMSAIVLLRHEQSRRYACRPADMRDGSGTSGVSKGVREKS